MKKIKINRLFLVSFIAYFLLSNHHVYCSESISKKPLNVMYIGIFNGRTPEQNRVNKIYDICAKAARAITVNEDVREKFNNVQTNYPKYSGVYKTDFFSYSSWKTKKDHILFGKKGFENYIDDNTLAIAFFTVDHAIHTYETQRTGLTKVNVYVLLSFYIYHYANRHIIYNCQFIEQLDGFTEQKDINNYSDTLFENADKKIEEIFKTRLPEYVDYILQGKALETALKDIDDKTESIKAVVHIPDYAYTCIKTDIENEQYHVKIRDPEAYSNIIAYWATIKLSQQSLSREKSSFVMFPPVASYHYKSLRPDKGIWMKNMYDQLMSIIFEGAQVFINEKGKIKEKTISTRDMIETVTGDDLSKARKFSSDFNKKQFKSFDGLSIVFQVNNLNWQLNNKVDNKLQMENHFISRNQLKVLNANMELISDEKNEFFYEYILTKKFNLGENVILSDSYFYSSIFNGFKINQKKLFVNGGPFEKLEGLE